MQGRALWVWLHSLAFWKKNSKIAIFYYSKKVSFNTYCKSQLNSMEINLFHDYIYVEILNSIAWSRLFVKLMKKKYHWTALSILTKYNTNQPVIYVLRKKNVCELFFMIKNGNEIYRLKSVSQVTELSQTSTMIAVQRPKRSVFIYTEKKTTVVTTNSHCKIVIISGTIFYRWDIV